jgi:hypothetical protein
MENQKTDSAHAIDRLENLEREYVQKMENPEGISYFELAVQWEATIRT